MSDVYKIKIKEDNLSVPSKQYVDARIQTLLEDLETQNRVLNQNRSIGTDSIELSPFTDLSIEKTVDLNDLTFEVMCDASNVKTSADRRFVSEELLNTFRNKPSLYEINELIQKNNKETNAKIDQLFTNILNSKEAMDMLNTLVNLIKENDQFNILLSSLSHKVDDEEFYEHVNSYTHISKEDRDNLNYLGYVAKYGIDWESGENTPISIRNKPESLPANGGNADSVGGYTLNDIRDLIGNRVLTTEMGDSETSEFDVNKYTDRNKITISEGAYNYDLVNFKNEAPSTKQVRRIVSGDGEVTEFKPVGDASKVELSNIDLRDIKFNGYKEIMIYDKTNLSNVYFKNCTIILNGCNMSTIKNCTFDNCIITTFRIINCVMADNFFIKTPEPSHTAPGFIFKDNIRI